MTINERSRALPTKRRTLRVVEIAAALDVCPATIYRKVRAGEIPCVRSIGGAIRIPSWWLEEILNGTGSPTRRS
jgi:excisionase family DNA binding protein